MNRTAREIRERMQPRVLPEHVRPLAPVASLLEE